jgi:hypothetical protein
MRSKGEVFYLKNTYATKILMNFNSLRAGPIFADFLPPNLYPKSNTRGVPPIVWREFFCIILVPQYLLQRANLSHIAFNFIKSVIKESTLVAT